MIQLQALLMHLLGDYIIQTPYMAMWKVRKMEVALWHAVTYTLPFLFLTQDWLALSLICFTHALIDRYGLAKELMKLKGNPTNATYVFPDGVKYDYYTGNMFLVYVVTDNTFHLIINAWALTL